MRFDKEVRMLKFSCTILVLRNFLNAELRLQALLSLVTQIISKKCRERRYEEKDQQQKGIIPDLQFHKYIIGKKKTNSTVKRLHSICVTGSEVAPDKFPITSCQRAEFIGLLCTSSKTPHTRVYFLYNIP
jgi:hypothetical protein